MTEFGYSFETFVCPEKDFFSGSRDETLPCFVETLQFVFVVPYDGCSTVSPLYQIRIGRAPPDRHATSFECFFFFFGDFAFNCSLVYDEELGQAGDVFWKITDSHPVFHDRDAVFVAEL